MLPEKVLYIKHLKEEVDHNVDSLLIKCIRYFSRFLSSTWIMYFVSNRWCMLEYVNSPTMNVPTVVADISCFYADCEPVGSSWLNQNSSVE